METILHVPGSNLQQVMPGQRKGSRLRLGGEVGAALPRPGPTGLALRMKLAPHVTGGVCAGVINGSEGYRLGQVFPVLSQSYTNAVM